MTLCFMDTALGDARMVRDLYDAVMSGEYGGQPS
jgi:hypothetical protein